MFMSGLRFDTWVSCVTGLAPPSHGSIVFHGNFGCIFDFHDRIRVDIVRNHEAMFRGHCLSSSRSKYSSIDSNFRDKRPTPHGGLIWFHGNFGVVVCNL